MNIRYPETKTVQVVDTIFGTPVPDPYRWFEDVESPEVQKWIEEQNKLTMEVLRSIPVWKEIKKELEEIYSIDRFHMIYQYGKKYFFRKSSGLQNHPVLYFVDDTLDFEKSRVAIDPNTFSEDGTVSLDCYYISEDGRFIAYGKSSGGTENSTLYIIDLVAGKDLKDTIPDTKWASLVWLPDNSGFYYTRNTTPDRFIPIIFYHRLVDDWKNDKYVFGEGLPENNIPGIESTSDHRYPLIYVMKGWTSNDVYIMDWKGEKIKPLITGKDASFHVEHLDGYFIVKTTLNAPRGKVISIPVDTPDESYWKEIIPESDWVIQEMFILGKRIVLRVKQDTYTRLLVYKTDGTFEQEIPLPGKGVAWISGKWDSPEVFVYYESLLQPSIIFSYNLDTHQKREIWRLSIPGYNPEEYEEKLVFYTSKDGTEIPMFIIHKKGIKLNGNNPALLTGYGGFGLGISPYFVVYNTPWLKRGGIFAYPGIRGGNEYGEEWHKQGMRGKKQNVFDDFISAAEYLIEQGYTSPEKLAISGGSNGGLLVGAVLVQRPDLFRAVVCKVPLLDMIRYHKFLVGSLWISEYGNPDVKEDFEYLIKYSPYHNVKEKVVYPSVLFWTAEGDTRVHPMHALKMAAKLQRNAVRERPVLLYVEPKAGHGAGKPLKKGIEDTALTLAFLMWQVQMVECE